MAINFPSALDTTGIDTGTLPQPTTSDTLNSATSGLAHHTLHSNIDIAVVALETKVGISNSQDATTPSLDLRTRVLERADYTVVPNSFSDSFTDDEFNATTVNSGLWTNLNSPTASQTKGNLVLSCTENGSLFVNGIYQTAPTNSTWTVESKLNVFDAGGGSIGSHIFIRDTGGKLLVFGKYSGNIASNGVTGYLVTLSEWASPTSFTANVYVAGSQPWRFPFENSSPLFVQIQKTATNYNFNVSVDGVTWIQAATMSTTEVFFGTLSGIGLCIANYGTNAAVTGYAVADYIRQTA